MRVGWFFSIGSALDDVNRLVYIAERVNGIVYMAMDFKTVTEALFAKTKPEDLAEEIGCSLSAVKQAQMDEADIHIVVG